MRAAVYNRFWPSLGGGERHSGKLAEVLARDGWEVDLLGHAEVDVAELSSRLDLDLTGVRLLTVPDRGADDLAARSAGYDLFVNASYMSRLAPRARRNVYLCYFPTPADQDLAAWRRQLARRLGPVLARGRPAGLEHGAGWYPPEGGLRRGWAWTYGDAVVVLPAGVPRRLALDVGRPGGPAGELSVRDETGAVLATLPVTAEFRPHVLDLGPAGPGTELHLVSDTFETGSPQPRRLGVAVSRLRLAGRAGGWRGRVANRLPWLLRDPADVSFLAAYDCVLANSEFTRGWIRRLWRRDAEVLYPPVRVDALRPREPRRPVVLSVGRFFPPGLGNAKRQLELVAAFGELHRSGDLAGWELHLAGGCQEAQLPYLADVRRAGAGLPVHVHPNAPRELVDELLTTAAVYWSATGLGEDESRRPWAMEHFGITTVEAMAGGCVPVVIDRAGQREIVADGVHGFRWSTPAELKARTLQVAGDADLRARLAAAAAVRARDFSDEAFARRWREIAAGHGLAGP